MVAPVSGKTETLGFPLKDSVIFLSYTISLYIDVAFYCGGAQCSFGRWRSSVPGKDLIGIQVLHMLLAAAPRFVDEWKRPVTEERIWLGNGKTAFFWMEHFTKY